MTQHQATSRAAPRATLHERRKQRQMRAIRKGKIRRRKQRLQLREQLLKSYSENATFNLRLQALGACVPENFRWRSAQQYSLLKFHQPLYLRNVAYQGIKQPTTEILPGICNIMEQHLQMYLHDREQFFARLYYHYFQLSNLTPYNQLVWRGEIVTQELLYSECRDCEEAMDNDEEIIECPHRYLYLVDCYDVTLQQLGKPPQLAPLLVKLVKNGGFGKKLQISLHRQKEGEDEIVFPVGELPWFFYHLWTWDELVAFIDSEMQTYGKLSTYLFEYDGTVLRREPYVQDRTLKSHFTWLPSKEMQEQMLAEFLAFHQEHDARDQSTMSAKRSQDSEMDWDADDDWDDELDDWDDADCADQDWDESEAQDEDRSWEPPF